MLSRFSYSTVQHFKASKSLRNPLVRNFVKKFKSSGNENFVTKEKGKILNNFKLTLFGGATLGIISKGNIKVKCETRVPQLLISQKQEDVKFDWKFLWSYLKDHLMKLIGAIIAGLAVACLNICIPLVLAQFVDAVTKYADNGVQRSIKNFIKDVVLQEQSTVRLLVLYGAQSAFTFLYIYLLGNIGEKMALDMRRDLFEKILMQDVEFFDSHHSGELLNKITSDVQEFKSSFKQTLSQGLRCIAQLVGGSISLFFMSPQLATVALVSVSSTIFLGSIMGRSLEELSKKSQAQTEKATNVCSEALTNIRTVKACATEHIELMMFEKELEASKELSQQLGTRIAVFQAFSNMFLNCIVMGTLYYGGHLISTESITSGELMSFMYATQNIQKSLQQGSILLGNFIRGLTAGSRVFELIKIQPKIDLVEGLVIDDENLKGEVRFEKVTFSYPSRPDQIVLDEFSLTIKSGQTVAIVGMSGSGKTTIAELLERFYEPTSGKIYLDGVEFSEISPVWLRNDIIGYIDQEPTLFGCSILDNIRYGRENATFEEIIDVSKQAQAHDFIEKLPEQYETSVGERGGALSGGQRQRIAMARALIKKPIILILDEATSALDARSAQELQKALKKGTVNQTKLIIAHRLSPIQYADLIVLIEDGQIIERGTHDQLILKKGAYYDLVRQEQQKETKEDKQRFLLKKVVKEYVSNTK